MPNDGKKQKDTDGIDEVEMEPKEAIAREESMYRKLMENISRVQEDDL